MRRRSVLVTDGGNGQNRSALAAVRALGAAGWDPVVTVSGGRSLAAASRACRGVVAVPPVQDPAYATTVRQEVERAGHLLVLAASDAAVVALGAPGARLVDKQVVHDRAREAGMPVLSERLLPDAAALREAAHDLAYPLVVKPAVRTPGSPPVRRVDGPRALQQLPLGPGAQVVQPYVDAPLSAVCGVVWEGRLVAVVHQRYLRIWPVGAGVASALVTVDGEPAREEQVRHVLGDHAGVFQAQFVGPYLVDVNPRVYGSLPAAVAAGADLPSLHAALAAGDEVASVRGRAGVHYRWIEGDVRALLAARRTGTLSTSDVLRGLRPRRGTAHSTEDLHDPRPALVRLRTAAARHRQEHP